jgi:sRNA-binding protein
MNSEEIRIGQQFDDWVGELLDEGYDLSKYTWEGLFQEYMKENVRYFRRAGGPSKEWDEPGNDYGSRGSNSDVEAKAAEARRKAEAGARRIEAQRQRTQGASAPASTSSSSASASRDRMRARGTVPTRGGKPVFEQVSMYLYNEGYASTVENAYMMAENISEEWFNEIVDVI